MFHNLSRLLSVLFLTLILVLSACEPTEPVELTTSQRATLMQEEKIKALALEVHQAATQARDAVRYETPANKAHISELKTFSFLLHKPSQPDECTFFYLTVRKELTSILGANSMAFCVLVNEGEVTLRIRIRISQAVHMVDVGSDNQHVLRHYVNPHKMFNNEDILVYHVGYNGTTKRAHIAQKTLVNAVEMVYDHYKFYYLDK